MPDPLTFLQSVAGALQPGPGPAMRLAVIDPAYDPFTYPATLPLVTFEGEPTLSGKRYVTLQPYRPQPSDRVLMVPVGNTYVIAGTLTDTSRVGRGYVTGVSTAGDSAAIGNGFTTIQTTPSITWAPNRAYWVKLDGVYQASAANMAVSSAVSDSAGATLCNLGRVHISLASTSFGLPNGQTIFTTGGSAVTGRNLQWRLSSATALQTVTCFGPRQMTVYDIGAASDHPGMPVMV